MPAINIRKHEESAVDTAIKQKNSVKTKKAKA